MEPQYIRKGNTIRETKTQDLTTYPSINAAKRASRKLQSSGATLRKSTKK